jgi:hypothetical protein
MNESEGRTKFNLPIFVNKPTLVGMIPATAAVSWIARDAEKTVHNMLDALSLTLILTMEWKVPTYSALSKSKRNLELFPSGQFLEITEQLQEGRGG